MLLAEVLVNVPQPPLGVGLIDATIYSDYRGLDMERRAGISTLIMRKADGATLRGHFLST